MNKITIANSLVSFDSYSKNPFKRILQKLRIIKKDSSVIPMHEFIDICNREFERRIIENQAIVCEEWLSHGAEKK